MGVDDPDAHPARSRQLPPVPGIAAQQPKHTWSYIQAPLQPEAQAVPGQHGHRRIVGRKDLIQPELQLAGVEGQVGGEVLGGERDLRRLDLHAIVISSDR